jgi:hypothetical protein
MKEDTMLAAVRENYAEPETVALRDVDRPTLGDQEVLVEVRAAGLDPGSGTTSRACPISSGLRDMGCGNPTTS